MPSDDSLLPDSLLTLDELPPEWRSDPGPKIIDRTLVHKHRDENVLLSRIGAHTDRPHTFAAQIHVDRQHPFFFEHPVEHVPGLLLVEAARQFGIAVAHRHYDVPSSHGFILSGFDIRFTGFARLDEPVFMIGSTTGRSERRGVLSDMTFGGGFLQGQSRLGRMTGIWRMVPAAVLARLQDG